MRTITFAATAAAVSLAALAALGGSPAGATPLPLEAERWTQAQKDELQFPQRPEELQAPRAQAHPSDEIQAPRGQAHPSDEIQTPRAQAHPSDGLQAPRAQQLPGDDTERPRTGDEFQAPRA